MGWHVCHHPVGRTGRHLWVARYARLELGCAKWPSSPEVRPSRSPLWPCGRRAQAHAAPLIDSTLLKGGAVAGRQVELQVRASDRQAPVTGMVVGLRQRRVGLRPEQLPAARLPGPVVRTGRRAGPEGHPGRPPHLPERGQALAGHQRDLRRLLARAVVHGPERPGRRGARRVSAPRPIVTTPPVTVPVGQLLPELPGLGELPIGSINVPAAAGPASGPARRAGAARRADAADRAHPAHAAGPAVCPGPPGARAAPTATAGSPGPARVSAGPRPRCCAC